ncbi:hypothetical protein GF318_00055 [Candidatus Micrarchaeota archaeon]|nr:hypothetical protein [Candidatus Micrarchaeota archaeon]
MADETAESGLVKSAGVAARLGEVEKLVDLYGAEHVTPGVRDVLDDILIEAVEKALEGGNVTQTLAIIGGNGIPFEIQETAVDVIDQNGKAGWLSGVFGFHDITPEIGMKILECLARNGRLSELLRLANGEKVLESENDLPEGIREKAKELLPECVETCGEFRLRELDRDQLVSLSLALAGNQPANRGVLSSGTIPKPAGYRTAGKNGRQKVKG